MLFIEARGRREGLREEGNDSSRQQRETEGGRRGRVKWTAGERERERAKGMGGRQGGKGDSEKERTGVSGGGREGGK